MRLSGKTILLGVCGSIAAYKSILLLRLLQQEGATVKVAMTPDAEKFVGKLTFESLSQHPVFHDLWDTTESWSQHVHLARSVDAMIIAPATANTIAKLAHGQCDNAVLALTLSAECPIWVCPAMDHEMYGHKQTQLNLSHIQDVLDYRVVSSGLGYLASGLSGQGRLAEPDQILESVVSHFHAGQLAGKKLLITAGPTQEPIDPVRFLSNHSSGKMGVALATVAQQMGAEVTMVAGPLQVDIPKGIRHVPVKTAAEMMAAVKADYTNQDYIIMAAAVADYAPAHKAAQKIKKSHSDSTMVLELQKTEDILAWAGAHKQTHQKLIGFALETQDAIAYGRGKMEKKKLDMIVVNSLADKGAGFATDTNIITILDQKGAEERYPLKRKTAVAQDILNHMLQL